MKSRNINICQNNFGQSQKQGYVATMAGPGPHLSDQMKWWRNSSAVSKRQSYKMEATGRCRGILGREDVGCPDDVEDDG